MQSNCKNQYIIGKDNCAEPQARTRKGDTCIMCLNMFHKSLMQMCTANSYSKQGPGPQKVLIAK